MFLIASLVISSGASAGFPTSNDIADGCGVTLSYATTREIPNPDTLSLKHPNNRPVVVVDDGTDITKELCSLLGERAVCLTFSSRRQPCKRVVALRGSDEKALAAGLTELERKYGHVGGFVSLESQYTPAGWSLMAAKHTKESLHRDITDGRCFFVGVARMDGRLGLSGVSSTPSADLADEILGTAERGAIFGLVKTLGLEWPTVYCRAIDVASDIRNEIDIARWLHSEIHDSDRCLREVGYDRNGQRWTTNAPNLREESTSHPVGRRPADYTANDVFLVAGGGRGITPVCMAALARRVGGGTFFLLGRSKVVAEPAWAHGLDGKTLQKAAITELKQKYAASGNDKKLKPTPKLHKALLKTVDGSRAVNESVARINAAGGTAHYLTCDACSESAVVGAIRTVRNQYGLDVTGIVQAAGVLRDKMVHNKTFDDFRLVYDTKIVGLRNMLKHVDRNKLRHLVVFSSLAGFHGNKGQSDYAMANDVLNKAAHVMSSSCPNVRVRALDFGPWDGGMVNDQLKAMFKAQGVEIIPYDEGAQIVAAMLCDTTSVQGLVGNWGLPPSRPSRKKHVITRTVGSGAFLDSHEIKGNRVLPLAVAVTSMAERTVRLYQGYSLSSIQDTQLFAGVTLNDRSTKTELSVEELPSTTDALVQVRCTLSTVDGKTGRSKPGYRCTVLLSSSRPERQPRGTGFNTNGAPMRKYNKRSLYDGITLFHGVHFQEVESVLRSSSNGITVQCRKSQPTGNVDMGQYAGTKDSVTLDVVMQTFLIWARHERGCASLPSSAKSIEYFGDLKQNEEYYITLAAENMKPKDSTWNATFNVHDKMGKVYLRGEAAVTLHSGLKY